MNCFAIEFTFEVIIIQARSLILHLTRCHAARAAAKHFKLPDIVWLAAAEWLPRRASWQRGEAATPQNGARRQANPQITPQMTARSTRRALV